MRRLIFLAALLAIPPPAWAGSIASIIYEFHDQEFPHGDLALMIVDGGALDRGIFDKGDVRAFAFPPLFNLSSLAPLAFPIDGEGIPEDDGRSIFAGADAGGTHYSLRLEFGYGSFQPGLGFWGVTPGGPFSSGEGYWTVTLVPAAVPEPSALMLLLIAAAPVVGVTYLFLREVADVQA